MRVLGASLAAVLIAAIGFPHAALAQTGASGSGGAPTVGDVTFFVAQKLWISKWDGAILDSALMPPSASNSAPQIRTSITRIGLDHVVPLTSLGVRIDRWTLSATVSPSTNYSDSRISGGSMSRSEYDVNLGYAVTPNITAALVYKGGKNSVRGLADGAAPQYLANAEQKLSGWGVGANFSMPVTDSFGAYGTLALVRNGSSTISGDAGRFHPKYSIAEVGGVYRMPVAFGGLSIQAGYRYQDITFNDAPVTTYALTPAPVIVARTRESFSSTTKGFVVGVAVSF